MALSGPIAHHPAQAGSATPRANGRHRPSNGGLPINTTLTRLIYGIAVTVLIGCGTPTPGTITNVTIDGGDRTLELGATLTLTATVTTTGNANDALTWTSSNTNVATIDQTGTVHTSLATGNTIIAASSTTDPTKSDSITLTVDPAGALAWTRQFGTGSIDRATGTATDASGNVYAAGATRGALEGDNLGGFDAFIRSYDGNGNHRRTRQIGTGSNEFVNGIATDANGNVYVTGNTGGALEGDNLGSSDAFIRAYER